MDLKHWILPNNQSKTHLIFFPILAPTQGLDPGQKGRSNFKKVSREDIWQVPEDHTDFFLNPSLMIVLLK